MLFAYAVTSGANTQTCVVGSWDGASAPRTELLIDSCDSQPGWRNADVHARLFRLADGTFGVLSPATLTTWSGATTKTRITAAAKAGGLLTLHAGATTATLAKHAAFPDHRLQDIVHASGNRYWILAGGGIFLWDASTDEIAFARHASSLTSLASATSGEAWAVGPGLLHYTPPATPPTSTK